MAEGTILALLLRKISDKKKKQRGMTGPAVEECARNRAAET